jgi:hypothetical protein
LKHNTRQHHVWHAALSLPHAQHAAKSAACHKPIAPDRFEANSPLLPVAYISPSPSPISGQDLYRATTFILQGPPTSLPKPNDQVALERIAFAAFKAFRPASLTDSSHLHVMIDLQFVQSVSTSPARRLLQEVSRRW